MGMNLNSSIKFSRFGKYGLSVSVSFFHKEQVLKMLENVVSTSVNSTG